MTIGDKIRELRNGKQYTQKELARILHVSDKTISKWERGKSVPDIETIKTMSEHFEIDMHAFFESSNQKRHEGEPLERKLKIIMWVAAALLVPLLLFLPVGNLMTSIMRSDSDLLDFLVVIWILFVGLSCLGAIVLIGYSYLTIRHHHETLDMKTMYRALHALLVVLTMGLLIYSTNHSLFVRYVSILWTLGIVTFMVSLIHSTGLDFHKDKGFKANAVVAVILLIIYLVTPGGSVATFTKSEAFFVLALSVLVLFAWIEEKTPEFDSR
ncbi:MAG: helix-turn-helix domain-containing protein [Candidatus Izemoplasmataceae bacterium]